jgi:hypothetical protein
MIKSSRAMYILIQVALLKLSYSSIILNTQLLYYIRK